MHGRFESTDYLKPRACFYTLCRWERLKKDSDSHKGRLVRSLEQFKKVNFRYYAYLITLIPSYFEETI